MKCADVRSLFENSPEVLTPGEVSALVRGSESTLYRLVAAGRLPCFCVGSHYRVLKRDVIRCLEDETYRAHRVRLPP